MNGRKFCQSLPRDAGPAREHAILEAIFAGDVFHDWEWMQVDQLIEGRVVRLLIMPDALRVGSEDPIRVNLTMPNAQRAADFMSCVLMTWKTIDLVHTAARMAGKAITPCTFPADASMDDTATMIAHSDAVDAKLRAIGAGRRDVHSTVGKDWVICNRLARWPNDAVNGGWPRTDGTLIQARGPDHVKPWHSADHTDYSQVVRLVSRWVVVDSELRLFEDVASDPVLHIAVSDEGPLRTWRHPAVPYCEPGKRPNLGAVPNTTTNAKPVVPATIGDDPEVASFRQAKSYTKGPRKNSVDLVVIHDMEAAETAKTAENVAGYFATSAPASAHYCVDSDSVVQCVREADVAWHAPGANHNGVGIELAGYAKQTAAEWGDPFSTAMLARASRLAAGICKRHAIPATFVNAAGLLRGERGITTHHEVSKAFKKSSHYDPGPNFPRDAFIASVRDRLG